MARFGLKKQGRHWGLFQGSEMVREAADIPARDSGDRTASGDRPQESAGGDTPPTYDNEQEYHNARAAFEEARHHPALPAPDEQRERERLQREVEAQLAALEAKHRRGQAIAWDARAEGELQALLHSLAGLLQRVGLWLPHGPGVIGNPEGLPGGEKREK